MNIHHNILAVAAVALCAACSGNDDASVGNGPGHADGVGGRADPPVTSPGASAPSTSSAPSDGSEIATRERPAADARSASDPSRNQSVPRDAQSDNTEAQTTNEAKR
jgi:hypothetical protein